MSKIVWDQTGDRKYEIGVSNGVLYTAAEGDPYGKGVPWNGLTNVTESPEGAEPTDLWADGIKYGVLYSTETYKQTIEAFMYPDDFAACDGSASPVAGMLVGQQPRISFGLCYRSEVGDDEVSAGATGGAYKLHLIYGCMASPSERTHAAVSDSPDAETMSWEVSTTPVVVPGYKPTSCITIDSATVDAEKLSALEAILYGTDAGQGGTPAATVARMPLPAEVITLLT